MDFIKDLKERGLFQDISDQDLETKLNIGDSFYFGADPTSSSLQIGNFVGLIVTARLAKQGIKPIMLYGGGTAAIGDPGGKENERNLLSFEEIKSNMESISKKVTEIFDRLDVKVEYVNNHDWLHNLNFLDYLRDIGKHFPMSYMLAKDFIKTRVSTTGISYAEFSYNMIQAYDFYHLYENNNCKMQICGSDQWGNVTSGLELIRRKLSKPAFALSWPLITKSDGKKFGKSEGGAVWLNEDRTSPYKLHQYFLNTPDEDVIKYLKIFTFKSLEEIKQIEIDFKENPSQRLAQKVLADEICTLIHGKKATANAKISAKVLFGESIKGLNDQALLDIFSEVPSCDIQRETLKDLDLISLFVESKATKSKGETRRLIENGGGYINNERVSLETDLKNYLDKNLIILRTGKKSYTLIKVI